MGLYLARVEFFSEKHNEFERHHNTRYHIVKADKIEEVEEKVHDYYKKIEKSTETDYEIKTIEVTEAIE